MKFNKIGVIGAGTMGAGIVQKIASSGLPVVMLDIKPEFVERGLISIKTLLEEGVQKKLFSPDKAAQILGRIKGSTDINDLKDADLIIEAVFEDEKVKKDLFSKLDSLCGPNTVFASNTSSFKINDLSQSTRRHDKFLGLHYFYHPAKNRLLEIIPGSKTTAETLDKADEFANLTGKTAILVKDAPGFAVNRFFVPWLNEAARMLEENMGNIPTIDEAAKRAFHIGMGPFLLMNVTGVPIAFHSTETLNKELGKFYATAPLLKKQFESGQKWNLEGKIEESKIQAISERFMGVVFYVASQLVDEGVASIEDTDRGAKIGLRWEKGPFEMMNEAGMDKAQQYSKTVTDKYNISVPKILSKQGAQPWQFKLVELSVKDNIAYITINRPEAMNALNEEVVHQLGNAYNEAESNHRVRAIVFKGKGKAFVAGADITYFVKKIEAKRIDDIIRFTGKGKDVLYHIDKSRRLTIAVLDGLALGGGAELALACDIILMTERASIGFPETGIGIYPGLGGTQRLPRLVGKALAKYLVFTGDIINNIKAQEFGLAMSVPCTELAGRINEIAASSQPREQFQATIIVSPETTKIKAIFDDAKVTDLLGGKLADSTDPLEAKLAKKISFKAPIALKLANELIDQGLIGHLEDGLNLELSHLNEIFSTKDAYEGLTSVVQKRRPIYTGK
ncbi:MAG: 3-hydroxyacyl-CoA dehydrogenase NAD-binding domain-containing protein [Candidatus Brocadiia bacterium]